MPGTLRIRPVREGETDAVWRLHEASMRASPLPFLPDVNRDLRRLPASYDDGAFLVGTLPAPAADDPDRRIVACGGLSEGPRWAGSEPRAVELHRLRVHPDHRRRGYATEVVRALERVALDRDAGRVVLETAAVLRGARALYRSLGYERTGTRSHPAADVELVRFERTFE